MEKLLVLSYWFDSVVGKKHNIFLEQVKGIRDDMRPNLSLFLYLGLYNQSFQRHSTQCYSTQLSSDV